MRDLDFFLSHTVINGSCLDWTRCLNSDGYPRCSHNGYSNGKVHRIVWELYNGRSAEGLVIRHSCDNPKCINPEHLLLGTVAENVRDMDMRNRRGHSKLTHDEVREIRRLWNTGDYVGRELGKMFGVDGRTIYSIVRGETWSYVI